MKTKMKNEMKTSEKSSTQAWSRNLLLEYFRISSGTEAVKRAEILKEGERERKMEKKNNKKR